MAKKVYAVRKGHKTGMFESWEECKAAIDGFSGSEYKSFSNVDQANDFLSGECSGGKNVVNIINEIPTDTVVAYIDGSFSESVNRYSFGCVLITPNKEIIKESGYGDDQNAITIRNVAGELQGALYATKWAFKNGYRNIEIYYDYEGIAKWITGEWKAKNSIVKLYVEEMRKLNSHISVNFIKVDAHTNDYFNDEADKLAKSALTLENKAKINKGDSWFTTEGVILDDLKAIFEFAKEEINNLRISEIDIPYGKKFEIIAYEKERICVQYYYKNNGLIIQGKPKRLFSTMLTYITELVDVEKIPEVFNNFYKLEISKENIDTEFAGYMPNAIGNLPLKIDRVLHQAVYNLNIGGDMFDATFLVEPVLRALDGHLKLILKSNGISLKEKVDDKQDRYYMFDKVGHKFQLKEDISLPIDSCLKVYIGRCYTFFHNHRHTLSHWDDPTATIDTTRLIKTTNDAHNLIKDTLFLIDEYYAMIR